MVYRIILSKEQVNAISTAILARKSKEQIVEICKKEFICGRSATFEALNPEKYNGTNVIHRCVLDAAVRFLEMHNVHFDFTQRANAHSA